MRQRIKAIILAKKKYREYDELIWLYSEDHGTLSAVIHGIKRKRSKYQGELALFSLVYVDIVIRPGLSRIYNFELIAKNIDEDALFLSYTYGSSMSELIRRVLPEKQAISGMFELLTTLFAMMPQLRQPELALLYLKQTLWPYTGSLINLASCVNCGEKKRIVGYSYRLAGLVCAACHHALQETDIRDTKKIKLLVAFFRLPLTKLKTLDLVAEDFAFLAWFWDNLYEQSLGITLKSQKVLTSLKQTKERV